MTGLPFKTQSYIPVISAAGERYSGNHGFSFGRDDNNEFVFFWGKNEGYTVDCGFSLVQSMWESEWIDYVNYGFIETALNFRVRGALGTNYLDLSDPDSSLSVAKEEIRLRNFHQVLPCEVFCVE